MNEITKRTIANYKNYLIQQYKINLNLTLDSYNQIG